ncbi:XRE family transcriptional regulator [Mycolicibacterium wolinskyi]|uniref:XRE family transcriptional regulator n=1 Tax=Mycolicibacterium wolinskyi TaxID=59750 RepID=A0A132PQ93_9MYCO|nr:helix-turn-helix transcriptional regulator [Mycolicibacterium wolinskyi]KWX24465.1 XRE family transcriptional regulator [Mycolicibacterium wolinskyi]
MDKQALAEFLRRRREMLRPGDVGLTDGPRRRTHGLRREEVAHLAGMSTDYYTRLEQQRAPQPSLQIAAALARALRLTQDETDHLFLLVGHNAPARFQRSEHVSPALMRVLDRLYDSAALVQTDLVETLAMNPLAIALLGDQTRHTGLAHSGVYRWFMDPAERLRFPVEAHERHGRAQAARLRAALTSGSDTARAAAIRDELQEHSPEFTRMWDLQQVAHRYDDTTTILHPELGRIDVDGQVLFTDNRAQTLVVLTARHGTESHTKLELLSVIGHQKLNS